MLTQIIMLSHPLTGVGSLCMSRTDDPIVKHHHSNYGYWKPVLWILLVASFFDLLFVRDYHERTVISDGLQAAIAIAVACYLVLAVRQLRNSGSDHARGWLVITVSTVLWAGGMIYFFISELLIKTPSYPGPADILCLIASPVMAIGVLSKPVEKLSARDSWHYFLDVASFAIVAFQVVWYFNLRLILKGMELPGHDPILEYTLINSSLDYILLVVVYSRLVRKLSRGSQFYPLLYLAAGSFSMVCSDMLVANIATSGAFMGGTYVDFGWMLYSFCIGMAALNLIRESGQPDHSEEELVHLTRTKSVWVLIFAQVWIGISIAVMLWSLSHSDSSQPWLYLVGVATVVCMSTLRQVSAHHELNSTHEALHAKLMEHATQIEAQRKRIEASDDFRQQVFNGSATPTVIVNGGAVVIDCNPAALELWGYEDRSLVVGRSVGELSPTEQENGIPSQFKVEAMVGEAIKVGHYSSNWTFVRPDASPWVAEISLLSFEAGAEGKLVQFSMRPFQRQRR